MHQLRARGWDMDGMDGDRNYYEIVGLRPPETLDNSRSLDSQRVKGGTCPELRVRTSMIFIEVEIFDGTHARMLRSHDLPFVTTRCTVALVRARPQTIVPPTTERASTSAGQRMPAVQNAGYY